MYKLKQEFELEKIVLEVAKVEAETLLKGNQADLESAEKTSRRIYNVILGWKENCSRRNEFIADMCH